MSSTSFRRIRARGFTLTELMISLVMGLIVSLAAVGLARTATTTFHEQARSSQTEMSVRTAAERLRQDLSRVSYMSTGNIVLDPKIAQLNGATTGSRYPETATLRGIAIDPGMTTVTGTVPALMTANGLTPDALDLVGNFMTDDAYSGTIAMGSGATGAGCANPQVITLDPTSDAAVYALGGGTTTVPATTTALLANATAAFVPGAAATPPTAQLGLAQVIDAIGCTNYVPVCAVGINGSNLEVVVSGGGNLRGVLYANAAPGYENPTGLKHSCGASENGKVTIAPLAHVRWFLNPSPPELATDPGIGEEPNAKYDLVRQLLDFTGAPIGAAEIIAEYAVDLKFGIVYDDSTKTATARQVIDDLDTDPAGGDIYKTTAYASADSVITGKPGPQRVRAVKFRIAVRTSMGDRENNLPSGASPFLARYCINTVVPGGMVLCNKWARVRTVVSEVGLTNQARMTY